ncbi:MAG: MBOAT family O-acyltransferase [Gammaproteobacteria bacterium]
MYFNTLSFFAFFLATWLMTRYAGRPASVLLVASALFYVLAGWFDAALIATLVGFNWLLIRLVARSDLRILAAVIVNIGVLAAVKYRVFLLGDFGAGHASYIDTVLPLGISFYTFQLLGYQIDAARDPALREDRFAPFTLFVVFFPQLIAGPIVRARELLPQLRRLFRGDRRRLRFHTYALGLCALGLTKKIVFADSLAPIVDDIFFLGPQTSAEAWTGAWLFTFQIYFDFSGYSDIAVGCAYLLGIRLPRNFRTPYLSTSPREFWQRWHITLSRWIRDYLYIPLGGSRGSRTRQLATLLCVMGLAGLWHGANVTFVAWGLLWGAYIALHRLVVALMDRRGWSAALLARWPVRASAYAGHLMVVVCLWVFFRAENFTVAKAYFAVMFSVPHASGVEAGSALAGAAALLLLHRLEAWRPCAVTGLCGRRLNHPIAWGFLAGVCLWLVLLPSYTQNPFIYFRF